MAGQLTENYSRDDGKADSLYENVQPPIRRILLQLLRRQLQPAHEKDEGDGTVEDTILGADCPAMLRNGCSCHIPRQYTYLQNALLGKAPSANNLDEDIHGKKYPRTHATANPMTRYCARIKRAAFLNQATGPAGEAFSRSGLSGVDMPAAAMRASSLVCEELGRGEQRRETGEEDMTGAKADRRLADPTPDGEVSFARRGLMADASLGPRYYR